MGAYILLLQNLSYFLTILLAMQKTTLDFVLPQKRYTIQEYADKMQVNASTVYRWSQQGKLTTEKIDGVLHVIVDDEETQDKNAKMQNNHGVDLQPPSLIITDMIAEMKERIESLAEENKEKNRQIENLNLLIKQMQQDAAEARQRSDTIILSLTRQFEEQTKLLEDMRGKFDTARKPKAVARNEAISAANTPAAQRSLWSRVKATFGFAAS
ncbi:MAG: hypothetical protein H8E62_06185 [Planctomycetes bacterium]|nr:hypothetical protein [Planctomycetota bacterium]